jgi:ankyrin repeat protein
MTATTAIVQHHTKRHGYLFNDILLITSSTTSTSMVNFSSEKINIHQIFYLDQISIRDLKNLDEAEDPAAFEIMASDRNYIYVAESEQDKRIWIEELTEAMFCIYSTMPNKNLGWFHEVIRGTFHSAAYYGDLELVRKHISRAKGKSLDVNDESGMNPLHWAALNGHQETVAVLIESGAEVDALNSGLNTPLLIASAFGHRDVIFCLLDHSSDVYIRNLKDYDCLLMLLLFGAYGSNAEEIISAFKVRGIDINKQDITGVTPLHECSSRNLPISIQALVDAGADINMKHGRNGLTPLQLACSSAQPDAETIRSLLDKGALPNWKDINKQTAFDMICKAKQKSVVSVKNADTTSPSGLKKTIDSAADFIQLCLPALMELVRKGARFTPEAMELFRPSFRVSDQRF